VAVVDGSSLYVVSAEGGAPRRILDLKEPSQIRFSSLAWTPDARWLLFGKWNGDRGELWRISPDGGTAQFAGLLARDEYPYFLRVSPDGLKLAFSLGDGALPTSEIWVMENFLAAK
jgi:Tol biopolymer transport system component